MSDIVKLSFENAGAASLAAGIATFGQVFLPGEVPSGAALAAQAGGTSLGVQMDVKTRYEDGSVKMAVLSVERPALAAGQSLEVTLASGGSSSGPALDLGQALAGHSFQVDLNIHGGGHVAVDVLAELQAALANGTASFWQQGDLASQARVEVALEGSQRLIFDVTAYKGGGFSVDAQFNNDVAMGAEGGRVAYDVTVTMDGKQALQTSVDQGQYQNWHESFSSNATDGGQGTGSPDSGWLNIRQDISHLQAAGVVATYNLNLQLDQNMLAEYGAATQEAGWGDPLATNGVTQYMPGTGGRADIGITTEANTAWLISQDPRVAAYALGQAEAAGSVPWHFWDEANDTWLNTDAYPHLWTDGRGGTGEPGNPASGGLTQQGDDLSGWTTDPAHQPSLSFVPYVLTGERWMLDNLEAQAVWNIIGQYPGARGDADDNLVNMNQVRGAAWALRTLDDAAWAAPDGSAEKAYLQAASDANWSWLVSMIPEWTAMQGEAHGWVPGTYGADGALPPWQQDYFASTVIAAASRGNADALTFLEWQSNFLVGRFTHAADGFAEHDGAAYLIAISDQAEGAAPYKTWAEIGAQTVAREWSNGEGWSQSQGDYAQLAVGTLAAIARLTGSAEAKAAYDALMADSPPFTSSTDFARDPTYAIAGPDVEVGKPVPIPEGPSAPAPTPAPTPDPTPDPAPNPTPDPVGDNPSQGGDTVHLAVVLGAESWNGHPIAVVRVDGKEVFSGEISAQHAAGGQKVDLGDFAAGVEHKVTVDFVNDGWGGTTDTDRNLHVEAVLVDGVDTGNKQALLENGEAVFTLPAKSSGGGAGANPSVPASPSTPNPAPQPDPTVELPSHGGGTVELAVVLGAESWNGNPIAVIRVDGEEVFSGEISAQHAKGGEKLVLGSFAAGVDHQVTVDFVNDGWGGTADTDRNLYVEAVLVDGVDTGNKHALLENGEAVFDLPAKVSVPDGSSTPSPAPQPQPQPVPETPAPAADTVNLAVVLGAQSWNGHPIAVVRVDGEEVFRGEISAQHGTGGQKLDLGGFAAGVDHQVSVDFINDGWGGTADTDRNLYVEAVLVDGVDTGHQQALEMSGEVVFDLPAGITGSPSTPSPAPEREPVVEAPAAPADVDLAVVLGAESWNGHPLAVVWVDGEEVFRGEISAQHATGGQKLELGSFAGGVEHEVTVGFLNDAWGGTAETDRNLHVEAVLVDGVDMGHQEALVTSGEVAFTLPATGAVALSAADRQMAASLLTAQEETFSLDTASLAAGASEVEALRVYTGGTDQLFLLDGVQLGGEAQGADQSQASLLEAANHAPSPEELAQGEVEQTWHTALQHNADAVFPF